MPPLAIPLQAPLPAAHIPPTHRVAQHTWSVPLSLPVCGLHEPGGSHSLPSERVQAWPMSIPVHTPELAAHVPPVPEHAVAQQTFTFGSDCPVSCLHEVGLTHSVDNVHDCPQLIPVQSPLPLQVPVPPHAVLQQMSFAQNPLLHEAGFPSFPLTHARPLSICGAQAPACVQYLPDPH